MTVGQCFVAQTIKLRKVGQAFGLLSSKQNWVNLKDNGYPIFSYVNAIYTTWEKIVWYLLEWKRLRCSVQGEGGQDSRNVNFLFERKVLLC